MICTGHTNRFPSTKNQPQPHKSAFGKMICSSICLFAAGTPHAPLPPEAKQNLNPKRWSMTLVEQMGSMPQGDREGALCTLGEADRMRVAKGTTTVETRRAPLAAGAKQYPSHKSRSMGFVKKMKNIPRGDWEGALRALGKAERVEARIAKEMPGVVAGTDGAGLTLFMYSSCLRVLATNRKWREALGVLGRMQAAGLSPDQYCLAAALEACAKAGQSERSLELLEEAKSSRWVLDRFCYVIVITACASTGYLEQAVALLREMPTVGVTPNTISYSDVITACGNAGEWRQAVALLREMPTVGVTPDVASYSATITACGKAGEAEQAVALLKDMLTVGVAPDGRCFGAALLACIKVGEWEQALVVLRDMQGVGITHDVVAYNSAMAAGEKEDQREQALALLREMSTGGVAPSAISSSTAVTASTNRGELQ